MQQIAIAGATLIHEDPYLTFFNGTRRDLLEQNGKPWMRAFLIQRASLAAQTDEARVTRVWGPDKKAAQRLATTFGVERVCVTVEEALDGADGLMVMDENVESRAALVEKGLKAGVTVYADKMLSTDPARVSDLIALAESRRLRVRSWSQVFHFAEYEVVRTMPAGGLAVLTAQFDRNQLASHGPHAVCAIQSAFQSRILSYRPVSCNEERIGVMLLENGVEVLSFFGPRVPWQIVLSYRPKPEPGAKSVLLDYQTFDLNAAFERSARAMLDLFMGRPVPITTAHMREVAAVVEAFRSDSETPRTFPGA